MPGRQRRQELDEIDRALVAALRRDGRTPNVELAKLVGVSEKTVRSRIARLVGEHGLTVTARLSDPAQRSRMVYLLLTEPGRRFGVAEFLAAQSEVDQVQLITGSADVMVSASFPDDAAALRFQVQVVEGHPGVRSAQSCHLIGEVGGPAFEAAPAGPRVDTEVLAALMIGPPRHPSFDALTDAICDAMTGGLGADRVLVVTSDRPNGDWAGYTVSRRRGISQRYLDALVARINDGRTDGVIKRVWESRLHMFLADARTDPLMAAAHDLVRAEGYVSLLTLPVLYGDSLVATISLYYDRPVALDDQYIATAQGVADHFAVTVARALGLAPSTIAGEPAPG
ncbi:AsnC family transcriptional regulator [Pseudonocardia sp. C8]|uniref:AsnC family transcriptional regulator n=1 Tax=Pseudonocardia sp. C8 TaxID=2762759 RepID=UPI0016427EC7|nr:AsnC family transcriptional regulator [Pseudonocardia sp. C8]MBC3191113.1 AsnC family transcriptional regulator [Pseudonocardia sp. C8]